MKKIKILFDKRNVMWTKKRGTFEKINKQKQNEITFIVSKPNPANMCE